eukprot:CAMPEP_0202450766 /NCGR_PEP_ID=MMETSP1360-20130828/9326_1 /ASSEMBLY_ACC=CAM_ASM_000848 /TAXON_ID=515479 /ORGANISM="Licmophora paradoxa, Strain CCMP2313" /LENGTH=308 /DNA_ID=CAMNT_0049069149 /DNA_START=120 /DNA_END=1046 /DNA_ORIENTATION=-
MSDDDAAYLEVLRDTDKLVIKQEVELLEAFAQNAANALDLDALGALGETANRYNVYTADGTQQFKVIESSEACGFNDCCIPNGRICCRPNHKLQLHVYEPEYKQDEAVMVFDRPCKCGQCCSFCDICRQEMRVYGGGSDAVGDPSRQIAYIKQPIGGGGLSPSLEIMERDEETPMASVTANAICCIGGICCDHTFIVQDSDGNEIGKIVKERPENLQQFASEVATDADNFTMYVPSDLDPKKKAAMLASLHLVDYMLFEDEGDANFDFVNGNCKFKCCDLYCCGCVVPCSLSCGGGDDSEEGPPPEEE